MSPSICVCLCILVVSSSIKNSKIFRYLFNFSPLTISNSYMKSYTYNNDTYDGINYLWITKALSP